MCVCVCEKPILIQNSKYINEHTGEMFKCYLLTLLLIFFLAYCIIIDCSAARFDDFEIYIAQLLDRVLDVILHTSRVPLHWKKFEIFSPKLHVTATLIFLCAFLPPSTVSMALAWHTSRTFDTGCQRHWSGAFPFRRTLQHAGPSYQNWTRSMEFSSCSTNRLELFAGTPTLDTDQSQTV